MSKAAAPPADTTAETETMTNAADESTPIAKAAADTDITMFAPIEKIARQADGTLLVDVTYSSEAVDDQNEIVDYDGLKKAAADYSRWGSVNEMHQPSAVGVALSVIPNDATRKMAGQVHVVDPVAVKKVETGVYKGVSIEGRRIAWSMQKAAGKDVRRVTDLLWTRTSLVDRPSNPDASLTIAKRSGEFEVVEGDAGIVARATTEPLVKTTADGVTVTGKFEAGQPYELVGVAKAAMSTADINDLPDSDFGYIEPGGEKDSDGKTTPRDLRHFPINDAAHVRNALARLDSSPFGDKAKAKVEAAAKKFGIDTSDESKAAESGDIAKTARGDTYSAAMALDWINGLIECEAGEQTVDDGQLAALRDAQKAILAFIGSEASEVGTPEDQAQTEADEEESAPDAVIAIVGDDMAYAAGKDDDIAKVADPAPDLAKIAADPDFISKVASSVREQLGGIATTADVEAATGGLSDRLSAIEGTLTEVAKRAAPGGPLRYLDQRGVALTTDTTSTDAAEVFRKAAESEQNPIVKEALQKRAATELAKVALANPLPLRGIG
ncbi:MAG TPA: hypothetical protein VMH41_16765 [Mycobacteriales bacterium]|nr:hypothetical protein [Mycobacteriales bacterium]